MALVSDLKETTSPTFKIGAGTLTVPANASVSNTNTGDDPLTLVNLGSIAHSATASTAILDADEVTFYSATLSALRKITWANIKVVLNGVYLALTGGTLTGNLNIGVSGTGADENIYATTGGELTPAITNALWTPGAGWTITDLTNIATRVASAVTTLVPATPITANVAKKYKRTFTISSWTAGTITATFGGIVSTPFAGNQTVSIYIEPYTTGTLIFTPSADFAGVISAISLKEMTEGNLTVENDITSYDSRGHINKMSYFIRHTAEMWQNTLLDKSQSTLSCTGSVLTYTLTATYGKGKFDFNGVIYPDVVNSVSIALTAGTDAAPVMNYVYFQLVGNTPTLSVATGTPPTNSSTSPIIRVARFVVGAVSGTSYTIYAYERYRQEVDTFVNRTISRIEASGSAYDSGLLPTVTSTTLSIAVGTFYNGGIFNMTSANAPAASGGFYWVDGLGAVHTATSIASLDHYGDGSNTAVSGNERQNIVWGIVPVTTTANGTLPTTVKLFAVLQQIATNYTTDPTAIQDKDEAVTLFPPNAEIAKCFVPVCRTIVHRTTPAFKPFVTGIYYKDMRGQVSTVGSTPVSVDITGLLPESGGTMTGDINFDTYKSIAMACDNGATIPTSPVPVVGQWFLHTPTGRSVLMQYSGTAWIPIVSLGTMNMFVSSSGTNDTAHGTAAGASAFLTIQYAINTIPATYGGNITINVEAASYSEVVTIIGKNPSGNSTITITGYDAGGTFGLTSLKTGTITSGLQGAAQYVGNVMKTAEYTSGVTTTCDSASAAGQKVLNLTATTFTQTNGALVNGVQYTLTTFVAGDNFSNVASVVSGTINVTGCVFIAIGTAPTDYTHGSTLTRQFIAGDIIVINDAAAVKTTVRATSAAGQKVLNVTANSMLFGWVTIARGTATEEICQVNSNGGVNPNYTSTMVSNLLYTHYANETVDRMEVGLVASVQAGVSVTMTQNLLNAVANTEAVAQCQYAGRLLRLTTTGGWVPIQWHTSATLYVTGYFAATPTASETYTIFNWGVSMPSSKGFIIDVNQCNVIINYIKHCKYLGNFGSSVTFNYCCFTALTSLPPVTVSNAGFTIKYSVFYATSGNASYIMASTGEFDNCFIIGPNYGIVSYFSYLTLSKICYESCGYGVSASTGAICNYDPFSKYAWIRNCATGIIGNKGSQFYWNGYTQYLNCTTNASIDAATFSYNSMD